MHLLAHVILQRRFVPGKMDTQKMSAYASVDTCALALSIVPTLALSIVPTLSLSLWRARSLALSLYGALDLYGAVSLWHSLHIYGALYGTPPDALSLTYLKSFSQ